MPNMLDVYEQIEAAISRMEQRPPECQHHWADLSYSVADPDGGPECLVIIGRYCPTCGRVSIFRESIQARLLALQNTCPHPEDWIADRAERKPGTALYEIVGKVCQLCGKHFPKSAS
jgi:hypothetical protein